MNDPRNVWAQDTRPILAARLPVTYPAEEGVLLATDGWSFERFERNGEMASIPYLRALRTGRSYEAPLVAWEWVQFEEQALDNAGT